MRAAAQNATVPRVYGMAPGQQASLSPGDVGFVLRTRHADFETRIDGVLIAAICGVPDSPKKNKMYQCV
jgi:hypothetical protein